MVDVYLRSDLHQNSENDLLINECKRHLEKRAGRKKRDNRHEVFRDLQRQPAVRNGATGDEIKECDQSCEYKR